MTRDEVLTQLLLNSYCQTITMQVLFVSIVSTLILNKQLGLTGHDIIRNASETLNTLPVRASLPSIVA